MSKKDTIPITNWGDKSDESGEEEEPFDDGGK
jgi:hypothetical protein